MLIIVGEPLYFLSPTAPGEMPPGVEDSLRQQLTAIRQEPGARPHGALVTTTYYLAHMDCPVEEQLIRNRLRSEAGIAELHFDLVARRLTIVHENGRDFAAILEALGMAPRLVDESAAPAENEDTGATPRREWLRVGLAGALALAAEIGAIVTRHDDSLLVALPALAALVISGGAPLRKAWLALKNRTVNIYLLMALAVGGAIAIRHWPEAAMVTVLFAVSELLEAQALGRARRAIRELEALAPDTAEVFTDHGHWHEVETSHVKVGQLARVRPGGRVPLDGRVTQGESAVNQAPITGESVPVDKAPGDAVFAGSINGHGAFTFEVTAAKADSTLARIARAVQSAHAQRAPAQRFVDSFARVYTPIVVLCAVLLALLPPLLFGADWQTNFYRALVLLVIACPCALVISTPVTIVSGLAVAARRGLVVKGGLYLEQGRRLRAVAFDKTGTLTMGKPGLMETVPLRGQSQREMLRLAAGLNAQSEHPLAVAFWEAWSGETVPVEKFTALPGRGVSGVIDGRALWLGNVRLAQENGAALPEVASHAAQGRTVVFLGSGAQILALFALADAARPEAKATVAELQRLGLTPILLSGDNVAVVQSIASDLGIARWRGALLPEEKLEAVAQLESEFGAVGMVGDGVNDAPALARATVGFVMGAAGSGVALETADVALMQDALDKLPLYFRLSRATMRVLWQNIALALGLKAVFFGLALSGHATLWMAVFADVGASLLVIFNGMRLLRFR